MLYVTQSCSWMEVRQPTGFPWSSETIHTVWQDPRRGHHSCTCSNRMIPCCERSMRLRRQNIAVLYDESRKLRRELGDRFAPERSKRLRRQNIAVWYDDESRKLRRQSRSLKRWYRRTRLPADRLQWVQQEKECHRINQMMENTYWLLQGVPHIRDNQGNCGEFSHKSWDLIQPELCQWVTLHLRTWLTTSSRRQKLFGTRLLPRLLPQQDYHRLQLHLTVPEYTTWRRFVGFPWSSSKSYK